jgi:hypothetical protein
LLTSSQHLLPHASARGAPSVFFEVRREKTAIFSGCDSRPAIIAPAGSNRSGEGGNEFAEAFDVRTALGSSASRQAGTQVNAV